MPIEKSAGGVVFRKENGTIFYLLLHYPSGSRAKKDYWDFPKGHIEKGETLEETVKREIKEETGLKDIEFIDGFKETIKYFFNFQDKKVLKFVTFFLLETQEKEVKISSEHIGYKWLPFEEALESLNFENAKGILKKANDFLKKKFKINETSKS
jgi:8-oxo-dGTP pyrophosphatase MutT (NUDIX family)